MPPSSAVRILAVEDDPVQVLTLRTLLRRLDYELVGVAATAADALQRFREEQPDLVLLDINLAQGDDGIALAGQLVRERPVPLIFLTAYPDLPTFERARQVGPFAFLGKPYDELLLGHSIELALQHFAAALGLPADASGPVDGTVLLDGVFVREGNRLLKVPLAELLVAEADRSYVHLHTTTRKYTVRSALHELEEKLPAGQFVRVHRSYVVRLAAIEAYGYDYVQLADRQLPLGRAHRDELLSRLPLLR